MLRKTVACVLLAAAWLLVGSTMLFFTMPLWGMHSEGNGPAWIEEASLAALLAWLASYCAVAVAVWRGRSSR